MTSRGCLGCLCTGQRRDVIMVDVSRSAELPSERTERLLRAMVTSMEPGAQLPPIKDLATDLGTTRTTLSRVMKVLEAEGLIVIRHGWGTFVADSASG